MISTISAVNAYKQALEANKKIKASVAHEMKPRAILRKGDDIEVLSVGAKRETEVRSPSFSHVLEEVFLQQPVASLKKAGMTLYDVAKADGKDLGPNVVELVEAVDKAQLTINTIVAIRDEFVKSYKAILEMPI